jgi:hypothetical protein
MAAYKLSQYVLLLLIVFAAFVYANEEEEEMNVEDFFNTVDLGDGDLNGPDEGELNAGPFGPRPRQKTKACWKDGESRGKGSMPDRQTRECPATQEKSMGMCYPHCGDKRNGFGPVCLDDCSKMIYKANGLVFCCDTDEICKELVQTLATKLPKSLVRFALDLAANPNDVRRIMRDFREMTQNAMQLKLPLCSKIPPLQEGEVYDEQEEDTEDVVAQNLPDGGYTTVTYAAQI